MYGLAYAVDVLLVIFLYIFFFSYIMQLLRDEYFHRLVVGGWWLCLGMKINQRHFNQSWETTGQKNATDSEF